MNSDRQNFYIARLLGDKDFIQKTKREGEGCFAFSWEVWVDEKGNEVADYSASLDACRQFELSIFGAELKRYRHALVDICQTPEDAITANAEQRCEAFLRVKGLWEEAK